MAHTPKAVRRRRKWMRMWVRRMRKAGMALVSAPNATPPARDLQDGWHIKSVTQDGETTSITAAPALFINPSVFARVYGKGIE